MTVLVTTASACLAIAAYALFRAGYELHAWLTLLLLATLALSRWAHA